MKKSTIASAAAAPTGADSTPAAIKRDRTAQALLTGGVVAGPLFLVVAFGQVLTRDGFDPARHPLSLLSLGELGWLQITNFVLAGLLFLGAAVGMGRTLRRDPGRRAGPILIGITGVGLVVGGIFVADPAFEFPPGTPPGAPDELTWHGILHGVAPAAAFAALLVACFVFARRFAAQGRRGWTAYCLLTGVASLPLIAWPNLGDSPEGRFVPLWVALVLMMSWLSAIAWRVRADRSAVEKGGAV